MGKLRARLRLTDCLIAIAMAAALSPVYGATVPVICPTGSLQNAINNAQPGDVIQVSGTCNENILIRNEKQRITIDGGGTATINAPGSASPALNIRGKGVLLQNFT